MTPDLKETMKNVFRPEAIVRRQVGQSQYSGVVLRLDPAWIRWAYGLFVGSFFVGILFLFLGRINNYAEGRAVVIMRNDGQPELAVCFPGRFFPDLKQGQEANFVIDGLSTTGIHVDLDRLLGKMVGRVTAHQHLSTETLSFLDLDQPVVLAWCDLSTDSLLSGDDRFIFSEGMQGIVRVKTSSTSIISRLLPRSRLTGNGSNNGL